MITKDMIDLEISTGLNFVCSSCEHWHNAKGKGIIVQCGQQCGGPSVGLGFPKYKGPFENVLSEYCFICGRNADGSVKIGDRLLGFCKNVGPNKETCLDKIKRIVLGSNNVIVKEIVVNKIDKSLDV
jgi:hypothetical protein